MRCPVPAQDDGYCSGISSAATTPGDCCHLPPVSAPAPAPVVSDEAAADTEDDAAACWKTLQLSTQETLDPVVSSPCHLRILTLRESENSTTNHIVPDLRELDVVIVGPGGFRYPVTVTETTCGPCSSLELTFLPLESGQYLVNAFYGPYMLHSCPTTVTVRRGPVPVSRRPVVSFDVEIPAVVNNKKSPNALPPVDDHKNKMTLRKPWGIAVNTRTEHVSCFLLYYFLCIFPLLFCDCIVW